jgi:hypothetical protein
MKEIMMAHIRLFSDDNFEGREISRTDSDANLHPEGFGDVVSSVIVVSGTFTLFQHINHTGFSVTVSKRGGPHSNGRYPSPSSLGGRNDVVSSIRKNSDQPQIDPWIGTWKIDLTKSEYSTGLLPPRSRTTTYEEVLVGITNDIGVRKSVALVDAGGNLTNVVTGPYLYDGKPYPVTGAKDYDASSYRRVNDFTYEATRTKAGQVVQTVVNVISADGNTRTVTTTGVDLNRRQINIVNVYERA